MAQGLINAPATFQRAMQLVLSGLPRELALVYINDLIIFLKDFDSHLEDLRTLLDQVQKCGLKLKVEKAQFVLSEVKYLGFFLSADGIRPDLAKLEALRNMEPLRERAETDHKALLAWKDKKLNNAKLQRWATELADHDLNIQHVPGRLHSEADVLSRLRQKVRNSSTAPCKADGTVPATPVEPVDTNKTEETDHRGDRKGNVQEERELSKQGEGFLEGLKKHSGGDAYTGPRIRYLKTEELSQSNRMSRTILVSADRFRTENGILYCMEGDREQLVVPAALRDCVIASNHDYALFGHLRTRRTLHRVKESFWWPSMANDMKDWCETCGPCQRRTPARGTDPGVTSIPVSGLRELYGMDIVGLFRTAPGGYKYILVVTDHYTKWAHVFPLVEMSATTIARLLLDFVFLDHGFPRFLLSDRGTNFCAEIVSTLSRLLGVERIRTTAYHPQGNGLTERFNQTLVNMLAKCLEKNPEKWAAVCRQYAWAYNTSVHDITSHTPYELMFGMIPPHSLLPVNAFADVPATDVADWLEFLKKEMEET
uniref:Integrase catalytic domain-containing protein n=1 Tax=Chromera velia CCMP2878 TaxID=1169474 RepID=A0A0G4FTE2_9ALVE|eukprot:Cvel_18640.t1-p1 / transcript=Cvel_18640.t1 / gene=Cvel_18640 / organism=Chromera_velia_CCMP2878 / gene_product=Transposon Ty3-I Gag-Pol polyprotein, putative / transcript_product=Transposon Ty3-I Gag-Pol polyprotein, putative / location=Cvel_scaffold1557:16786-18831(-) / protein_length=539 / sequence_SO=supercontig / SO=protein_coding / is_pseudo=false